MNPIYILSLRSLSVLFALQGQTKMAESMMILADAAEQNIEVDEHLQRVADALKAGEEPDLSDLRSRILTDSQAIRDS